MFVEQCIFKKKNSQKIILKINPEKISKARL